MIVGFFFAHAMDESSEDDVTLRYKDIRFLEQNNFRSFLFEQAPSLRTDPSRWEKNSNTRTHAHVEHTDEWMSLQYLGKCNRVLPNSLPGRYRVCPLRWHWQPNVLRWDTHIQSTLDNTLMEFAVAMQSNQRTYRSRLAIDHEGFPHKQCSRHIERLAMVYCFPCREHWNTRQTSGERVNDTIEDPQLDLHCSWYEL